MTWEKVTEPLVAFCEKPHQAPDRAAGYGATQLDAHVEPQSLAERDAEVQRLRAQVAGYESNKFVRLTQGTRKLSRCLPVSRMVWMLLDRVRAEYFFRWLMQEVGQASDHAFVDRAYWRILHRAPDLAGFEAYTNQLTQKRCSRRQVVTSLVGSEEFRLQPRPDYGLLEVLHLTRCQLVRQLPPARDVLDLGGAAPGTIQGMLLVMGYPHRIRSLTIVDLPPVDRLGKYACSVSEKADEWIETEMGPIRYLHTSMTDLSAIENDSLDLVFAGESIEHVSEGEGRRVMGEVFRVLRSGGYFCLDTPNGALTRLQSPNAFIHPEHRVEYRVVDLVARLREVGFQIIETKGICPMPRTMQTGVFDEREILTNAYLSDNAETGYLFYVKCVKPG
jgi:SAM-dependent methyltransferase